MGQVFLQRVQSSLHSVLHSPFGFQNAVLVFCLAFVLSFRPPYLVGERILFGQEFFGGGAKDFPITEVGFLDNLIPIQTAGFEEIITEDEQGNKVIKVVPRRREEVVNYIVRSGESISKIAHKFGLNVSTLLWANKLTSKETLQVGQKLRIPPTDGVFYTTKTGDTLGEIAEMHDIELEKIYAYNPQTRIKLLKVGEEVFLPEAKKVFIPQTTVAAQQTPTIISDASGDIKSIGIRLRRPTKGILTQGYHRQHYAIDISNKLNTSIFAAAGGVVTKSVNGWNYGYGKYIIVDHGNGVETLYAHLNERKIEEGEHIKSGQLIGLMGNTGNVWGPTGIHLHFEVRIRGRKVNPNNYF